MRTLALVATLGLAFATAADAHTKRLTVDQTTRWETPQTYGPHATVALRIYVNGHRAGVAYRPDWGLGYSARGVVLEARIGRRGPIRFRVANARRKDAHVRIVYRRG